jgi:triosephosphate isomerase (TIM)
MPPCFAGRVNHKDAAAKDETEPQTPMGTPRRLFIAGNWKMNLDRAGSQRLAGAVAEQSYSLSKIDVAVFPAFPYLADVQEALLGRRVALGAQNMHFEASGAFTGEVSPSMLADVGCKYVILGHSERRHVFGETDEMVNRKVRAAIQYGLQPILCVGELLAEREANRTNEVVERQLRTGLTGVAFEHARDVTVAYEPVWAIGTGKVATPAQAEEVHAHIRQLLTSIFGADLAQCIRLQYGGSVKVENVGGLLELPNVDGALVGGASLKAEEFVGILQVAAKLAK